MSQGSVQLHLIEMIEDVPTEPFAQCQDSLRLLWHFHASELSRRAKPHNRRDVERSRSEPALVTSSIYQWSESNSRLFSDEESSHSLGPVDLVRAQRYKIRVHL